MKKPRKIYYSMPEVAEILGWTTDRTRQWLRRNGGARKIGGRWMSTPDKLAATFPEAFQAFAR